MGEGIGRVTNVPRENNPLETLGGHHLETAELEELNLDNLLHRNPTSNEIIQRTRIDNITNFISAGERYTSILFTDPAMREQFGVMHHVTDENSAIFDSLYQSVTRIGLPVIHDRETGEFIHITPIHRRVQRVIGVVTSILLGSAALIYSLNNKAN